jgi:hypothetical protein
MRKSKSDKGSSPMTNKPKADVETEEKALTVKGFDRDLSCRGFKFEIGKTYKHDGDVVVCESGFHACEFPLDVFYYYAPGLSRYAEVTQAGELSRHGGDTKIASARITIDAEIGIPKIVERAIAWVLGQAKPTDDNHSTGDRSASSSTGDRSASSSTGYQSASSSTGYQSASSSTGDRSASSSTGYRSASSSTGYQSASSSTGDQSASSVHGERSCAMACGERGAVMAARDGCALFLVNRDPNTGAIRHAWAGVTGRGGIRAGVWYRLDDDGVPVDGVPAKAGA